MPAGSRRHNGQILRKKILAKIFDINVLNIFFYKIRFYVMSFIKIKVEFRSQKT